VGGTVGRAGDGSDPQGCSLFGEDLAQVHPPGSRAFRREPAPRHDLRTYFIALAANTDPAMHYHVMRIGLRSLGKRGDSTQQDPAGGAAPAGVEQTDSAAWDREVHGDAVGHGHGQQDAGGRGDPTVRTSVPWTWLPSATPANPGIAERKRRQRRMTSPTGASLHSPRSYPRPGSLPRPVIPATRPSSDCHRRSSKRGTSPSTGSSARSPGAGFTRRRLPRAVTRPARSRLPARGGARRSARSPARSAPHCGWCWAPQPRARRAAWPCRPGCRATPRCRP
jgi:hypothetical protein